MEKKRWSLIFIGLCLALVFSVNPVEAQMHHDCGKCAHCDRDGDGLIKDTPPCISNCKDLPDFMIDPNDREPDEGPNMCRGGDPEPDPFVPVVVCHFKNRLNHCEDPSGTQAGVFWGGGERTMNTAKQLEQHLADGDCLGLPVAAVGVNYTNEGCFGHCLALDDGGAPYVNQDCGDDGIADP